MNLKSLYVEGLNAKIGNAALGMILNRTIFESGTGSLKMGIAQAHPSPSLALSVAGICTTDSDPHSF